MLTGATHLARYELGNSLIEFLLFPELKIHLIIDSLFM